MRYFSHTTIPYIITAAALLFVSCNTGRKQYIIGVSQYDENEWSKQMNVELTQEANLQDMYDLRFAAADGDVDKQIEQIRAFMESDIDVIVVVPSDLRPLYPAILEAYDRGVKIVIYGEPTNDKYHSTIRVRDNIVGVAIGKKIATLLDDGGTIIELRSANNQLNSKSIADSIHLGFKKKVNRPGFEVISIDLTDSLDRAENIIDSLYSVYPKVDVVLSYTDDIATIANARAVKLRRNHTPIFLAIQTKSLEVDLQMIGEKMIDYLFIYPTLGDKIVSQINKMVAGIDYNRDLTATTAIADDSNYQMIRSQHWSIARRNVKLAKMSAHIAGSTEREKKKTTMLITISIVALSLLVITILILKLLRRRRQINEELSIQNIQITNKNSQLEAQKVEFIRKSSNLEDPTKSEAKFMNRLNELIDKNFGDPNFGVDQMCEELCYSRVQVYRKVKTATGESPTILLRAARVTRGDYLLRNTDKSITEIAFEVGYTSPSYFSKYYKEIYGVLPSEINR